MGKEIVYCDLCGERLLEQEFVEGKAVTLFNKNYCVNCKDEAIKNLSPDEVPETEPETDPEVEATPVPRQRPSRRSRPVSPKSRAMGAVKTPPPQQSPRNRTPHPRMAVPAGGASRMPIIIGAVVGMVAIILLIIIATSGGGGDNANSNNTDNGTTGSTTGTHSTTDGTDTPPPGNEREKNAMRAYNESLAHWRKNGANPQAALDFLEKQKKHCAGTSYWSRLREIEDEIKEKLAGAAATGDIRAKIKRAQDLMKSEREYAEFGTIKQLLAEARGEARRAGVEDLISEIVAIEKPYVDRYEREARQEYDKIYPVATNIARGGEYKNAISVIETFPKRYRQSQSWKYLEDLKRDYQRKMK